MKYIHPFLLLILCISTVQAQTELPKVTVQNVPSEKLRIDPNYARGGRTSQIFDTVIYTPLETRKECVVGYVGNLQLSEHYICFFDQDYRGLYVFGRDGKYICGINKLPLANWNKQEDGFMFYNFYLDKSSERIFVIYGDKSDDYNQFLAVFSPDGKLIHNRQLPKTTKYMHLNILAIDSTGNKCEAIASYNAPKDKANSSMTKYYLYKLKDFKDITDSLIPVDPKDPFLQGDWMKFYNTSTTRNDASIWGRQFDYNIYRIDRNTHVKRYQILLPLSMSIDSSFYKDTSVFANYKKAFDYFEGKNSIVARIGNPIETNDWLIFTLGGNVYPQPTMMYHTKSKQLVDFRKITSDSSSYYLPLSSWDLDLVEDGSIYNLIPAYSLFSSKESLEQTDWKKNPALKGYFEKQNRKSNPVLIQLKLKSKL